MRTWAQILHHEMNQPYYRQLTEYVRKEREQGEVFPREEHVFRALALTPLASVRVVIIGQDPYCSPGQAHGLAFSVPDYTTPPPSLQHILQELQTDVGARPRRWYWNPLTGERGIADPGAWLLPPPSILDGGWTSGANGNLEPWAARGVLLLNTCLTVRRADPFSHAKQGWERLTAALLEAVAREHADRIVFVAWGQKARQAAEDAIMTTRLEGFGHVGRHKIFSSPHPSPKSARDGFFGSKPFSRTNAYLTEVGLPLMDWSL